MNEVATKRRPGRPRTNPCVFCELRPLASGKCLECSNAYDRARKAWRKKSGVLAAMRMRLCRALAAGEIVRGPCVKCGGPGEEGILLGVESVSDVIWVCKKHGWEVRKERRARVKAVKERLAKKAPLESPL